MSSQSKSLPLFVNLLLDMTSAEVNTSNDKNEVDHDRVFATTLVSNMFSEELSRLRELREIYESLKEKEELLKTAHIALLMEKNMYQKQNIRWIEEDVSKFMLQNDEIGFLLKRWKGCKKIDGCWWKLTCDEENGVIGWNPNSSSSSSNLIEIGQYEEEEKKKQQNTSSSSSCVSSFNVDQFACCFFDHFIASCLLNEEEEKKETKEDDQQWEDEIERNNPSNFSFPSHCFKKQYLHKKENFSFVQDMLVSFSYKNSLVDDSTRIGDQHQNHLSPTLDLYSISHMLEQNPMLSSLDLFVSKKGLLLRNRGGMKRKIYQLNHEDKENTVNNHQNHYKEGVDPQCDIFGFLSLPNNHLYHLSINFDKKSIYSGNQSIFYTLPPIFPITNSSTSSSEEHKAKKLVRNGAYINRFFGTLDKNSVERQKIIAQKLNLSLDYHLKRAVGMNESTTTLIEGQEENQREECCDHWSEFKNNGDKRFKILRNIISQKKRDCVASNSLVQTLKNLKLEMVFLDTRVIGCFTNLIQLSLRFVDLSDYHSTNTKLATTSIEESEKEEEEEEEARSQSSQLTSSSDDVESQLLSFPCSFPSWIYEHLTKLVELELYQNNLRGPLPPFQSLSNLQHLKKLTLLSNHLTGEFPVELISNLKKLTLKHINRTPTADPIFSNEAEIKEYMDEFDVTSGY